MPRSVWTFVLVLLTFTFSPPLVAAFLGIPYMFDVAVMLLMLAAVMLIGQGHPVWAVVALGIAAFTKETGIVMCVAVACYEAFFARERWKAVMFLSPCALYVLVRMLGVGFGGTYATNDLGVSVLFKNAVTGIATVPTGLFTGNLSYHLAQVRSGQIDLGLFIGFLAVALNIALLLFLGRNARSLYATVAGGSTLDAISIVMLIFVGGYAMVLGLEARFLPATVALSLLLVLRLRESLKFSGWAVALWTLGLLLCVPSAILTSTSGRSSAESADVQLQGALARFQGDKALLINAPNVFSSPQSIAGFYGYQGSLEFLFNSSYACLRPDADSLSAGSTPPDLPQLSREQGALWISFANLQHPECYRVNFNGVSPILSDRFNREGETRSFEVDGHQFLTTRGSRDVDYPSQSIALSSIKEVRLRQDFESVVWVDGPTGIAYRVFPQDPSTEG